MVSWTSLGFVWQMSVLCQAISVSLPVGFYLAGQAMPYMSFQKVGLKFQVTPWSGQWPSCEDLISIVYSKGQVIRNIGTSGGLTILWSHIFFLLSSLLLCGGARTEWNGLGLAADYSRLGHLPRRVEVGHSTELTTVFEVIVFMTMVIKGDTGFQLPVEFVVCAW